MEKKMHTEIASHLRYKVGPLPVVSRVITPISTVKQPQLPQL